MSDLYYCKSHSKCFKFNYLYIDHFVIVKANVNNLESIVFAVSYIRDKTVKTTGFAYQKICYCGHVII